MKSLGWMTTGVATALLTFAGVSWADEPAKAPANPVDQSIADAEKAIADLTGISLSGMLYFSYLYNFNRPPDLQNSLRSLDNRDNQLYVDLFQLQLSRKLPYGLSLFTKLDVGNTASRIGADWTGSGKFTGGDSRCIRSAYPSRSVDGGMPMRGLPPAPSTHHKS